MTTINAAVGGAIVSIFYTMWRTQGRLVIPEHVVNGVLAALVAITASCACVHTYVAFPVGAIGALMALSANTLICHLKLDDPVGGIGHHGVSAIWGLISVGLFSDSRMAGVNVKDGLFYGGGFELLGLQLLEIISIIAWGIMWATFFFYTVGVILSKDWKNPRKGLRVEEEEEERGADWFLHGVVDMQALAEDVSVSVKKRIVHDPALARSKTMARQAEKFDHGSSGSIRPRPASLTRRSDMYARSGVDFDTPTEASFMSNAPLNSQSDNSDDDDAGGANDIENQQSLSEGDQEQPSIDIADLENTLAAVLMGQSRGRRFSLPRNGLAAMSQLLSQSRLANIPEGLANIPEENIGRPMLQRQKEHRKLEIIR